LFFTWMGASSIMAPFGLEIVPVSEPFSFCADTDPMIAIEQSANTSRNILLLGIKFFR
jgi:hypothetical protein